MSDVPSAHERRKACNRRAQQAYRKREASKAALIEAQRKDEPTPSQASTNGRSSPHDHHPSAASRPPHNYEVVFQALQQPSTDPSADTAWFSDCMKQMKAMSPREVGEFFAPSASTTPLPPTGQTPLHHAAKKNSGPMCDALLRYGAVVGAKDGKGRTPLHVAALAGGAEAVGILIGGGAVVDVEDSAGMTPLRLAVEHGFDDVVEVLLGRGADPNGGMVR